MTTTTTLRFTTPALASKKNRGKVMKWGNRYGYRPNEKALQQEKALREQLQERLGFGKDPHFGDRDVRVSVTYHARREELDVVVEDMGPRPKGFTGRKRDLGNLCEALLDAMQGPVIKNDNQVAELRVTRSLEEKA